MKIRGAVLFLTGCLILTMAGCGSKTEDSSSKQHAPTLTENSDGINGSEPIDVGKNPNEFSNIVTYTFSGKCGDIFWYKDDDRQALIFQGDGDIPDCTEEDVKNKNIPWGQPGMGVCSKVIIMNGVTGIGNYAFYSCYGLEEIVISDTVTSIGAWALANLKSMETVEIPDSVTKIEENAFRQTNLRSIVIPGTVSEIGDSAFEDCFSLSEITFQAGVEKIGEKAFHGCRSLTNISLGNEVTTIGIEAFGGCRSLGSIQIPDSVVAIGRNAFMGCTELSQIELPSGMTTIDVGVFEVCKNLSSITIPNSITLIEPWAFEGCEKLTDVYYTGSEAQWNAVSIGEYGNDSLKAATIHCLNTAAFEPGASPTQPKVEISEPPSEGLSFELNADGNSYSCTGLASCTDKRAVIPSEFEGKSVTGLYRTGDLSWVNYITTEVVIPDGVTSIADETFKYCIDMTAVYIPNSVTLIGREAFMGCDKLIIYCDSESTAQQYAEEHGISYHLNQ